MMFYSLFALAFLQMATVRTRQVSVSCDLATLNLFSLTGEVLGEVTARLDVAVGGVGGPSTSIRRRARR
jgi:hypothetical protein